MINIRKRVLHSVLNSYINFSSGFYPVHSPNTVFATILIAPLPVRSWRKLILSHLSNLKQTMTLKNWDSNEFFPYLCTLDTLLLFVDFLEYFWAHYTLEDHSFPKFHCVRIDMKIVYHCPIQHLTSRLKCIPLN